MQIRFSIYFTNHLKEKIKLDNYIVDIEDGVLENSNKKIYNSLTFVTNNIYYDPAIIGDLVERVEVKYKIDDEEEVIEKFVIDGVDYLKDNNIKVYCKTKTIKYSYKYSGNITKIVKATNLSDLISKLMPDIDIDFSNFTDFPLLMDYKIENKSIEDSIEELSTITGFDYYFYIDKLYIEDKKIISKNDIAIKKFTDIEDIINFSTTSNKDSKKINKLLINMESKKSIIAEPSIILEINDSPQCCSPDEILYYTDNDGNTYKINPVNAYFKIYYSPLGIVPETNLNVNLMETVVVEEFELEGDDYVKLAGGIKEIIDVSGVDNIAYEKGYNILAFDYVENGILKVSYRTDILFGTISHSKYPKNFPIYIKHFDKEINYTHRIELNGYYPLPYKLNISLIKDWGIDYENAIGGVVDVYAYSFYDKAFFHIMTLDVNNFGEFFFNIEQYGTYRFEREGQDSLFLDYYVNKFNYYMDEIEQ